ncbi:hypothetical protein MUK42_36153 [Musa troglodytarum]|uniref:Uncharacterized protein n=1 Tax=Musa troglodytarum TaxID=320322 RepID=A0A9E7KQ55_9LILI|nr:hypothetical protein MUK42_36153 [Musa troglodytarum]
MIQVLSSHFLRRSCGFGGGTFRFFLRQPNRLLQAAPSIHRDLLACLFHPNASFDADPISADLRSPIARAGVLLPADFLVSPTADLSGLIEAAPPPSEYRLLITPLDFEVEFFTARSSNARSAKRRALSAALLNTLRVAQPNHRSLLSLPLRQHIYSPGRETFLSSLVILLGT